MHRQHMNVMKKAQQRIELLANSNNTKSVYIVCVDFCDESKTLPVVRSFSLFVVFFFIVFFSLTSCNNIVCVCIIFFFFVKLILVWLLFLSGALCACGWWSYQVSVEIYIEMFKHLNIPIDFRNFEISNFINDSWWIKW